MRFRADWINTEEVLVSVGVGASASVSLRVNDCVHSLVVWFARDIREDLERKADANLSDG